MLHDPHMSTCYVCTQIHRKEYHKYLHTAEYCQPILRPSTMWDIMLGHSIICCC